MAGTADHFWTLDANGELLSQPPWHLEGPACWVFPPNSHPSGTVPFYRFYCSKSGDHFWTCDPKGEGLPPGLFHLEGPAAFVFPNESAPNTVPLYRFYSDNLGKHFWTLDKNGELLPKPEFHLEGPACYVFGNDPGALAVPLYRFYNKGWAQPTITSISPLHAPVHMEITIKGANLQPASNVSFGSTSARFNVISVNEIAATVPVRPYGFSPDCTIYVDTPGGRAASPQSFHVDLAPVPGVSMLNFSIDHSPSHVQVGQSVTITLEYVNTGTGTSPDVPMNFILDGWLVHSDTIKSLGPGGRGIITWTIGGGLSPGPHEVVAIVQGQNVGVCSFVVHSNP